MNGEANITDPVISFKINQTYWEGMSSGELYEITRGIWKVGPRSERARYAFAVYRGEIVEVFEIDHWQEAGATPYEYRVHDPEVLAVRREFVGRVAPQSVRDKYVGKTIHTYQTINYFNCPL